MIISYTLDNKLILNKEIKSKDIIKFTGKITTATVLIVCIFNVKVFAEAPVKWYKKALNKSEMYVYMRLWETVFADRVIEGIQALQEWPKEILDGIIKAGYTVEELIGWYVENKY
ncbi:hypothetical protein LPC13_15550 [Clostridium celatum]|uniref:hypothetical protein n=1 Tax=Clostridium celatum TaxID=36834 RepID=UPI001F35079C|nr:hypothetical protein [Clostridium celatum]MCE9656680.1 hypothetical protein [Clostridium celatum]